MADTPALACYLTPACLGFSGLFWVRFTVLPTSHRVAGRRFFDPAGRPGPGREGFGALAGRLHASLSAALEEADE